MIPTPKFFLRIALGRRFQEQPAESGELLPTIVEIPYSRKVILACGLAFALFAVSISGGLVATAAERIVSDLGGFALYPWLFAGYLVSATVAVPIAGKLSDAVGRKKVLFTSLALFALATGASSLAQNMPELLATRAIQGMGSAGVLGSVWIMIAALWAPEQRAKWLGILGVGFTASAIVGPLLGGIVSDALSWRWIFYINLGAVTAVLLVLWVAFPDVRKDKEGAPLDWAGAFAFAVFAASASVAMSLGGNQLAWTSPGEIGLFALSVAAVGAFWFVERRAVDPLMPLGLFRVRVFSAAMMASLTVMVGIWITTVFVPLFVQGVKGASATASSLPLITMALGVTVGTNLAGQTLARVRRPREVGAVGMGLGAAMLVWLGFVDRNTSLIAVSVATGLLGAGMAVGFVTFSAPVQNVFADRVLGVVTTQLQFARSFGQAAGTAALGTVLAVQLATGLASAGVNPAQGPEVALENPQVLVSSERLKEVKDQFILESGLGANAFQTDLNRSRETLARSLATVFRLGAAIAAFGAAMAFVAFSGATSTEIDPFEAGESLASALSDSS